MVVRRKETIVVPDIHRCSKFHTKAKHQRMREQLRIFRKFPRTFQDHSLLSCESTISVGWTVAASSCHLCILVTVVQSFQGVMLFVHSDLDMKMRLRKCDRFNTQLDHES